MSQYEYHKRQAKVFQRDFRMGSLFFLDIVPHPWEMVPDIVVSSSKVEEPLEPLDRTWKN
jgi:hypothetical protein